MLTEMVIIFFMIVILVALASALVLLVKDEGKTQRAIKALSWRIGLALGLFLFLLLAAALEWITPNSY